MSSTGNGQPATDIPTDRQVVLEARNVTKTFPGVVANKDVSLRLFRGEVLALLGENGAGKTTLMNILYGLYHQDAGEMFVRGEPVRISGPSDSIRRGIGMVHQHFMLVPVFTVAENIMLGAETVKGLSLDIATVRRRIRELAAQYNLDVDPDAYVNANLPLSTIWMSTPTPMSRICRSASSSESRSSKPYIAKPIS
jgi:general nucleoside transport system ATP-binding protein